MLNKKEQVRDVILGEFKKPVYREAKAIDKAIASRNEINTASD